MTTYQQLSEPFPQEMQRVLNKSGVNLVYIPVSEVINRLNKVLGVDKWSFTIVECKRDAIDPDYVVAHVRIDWYQTDFACVSRDGFGGQKIKRTKQGQIVDLGDEFKGAISDALKKAAQTLGVGLYLARSEDAMEIEQVIDATANIDPAVDKLWSEFVAISKKLKPEARDVLTNFWSTYSGGQPKPKSGLDVELKDLEALHAEAVRLSFGGEYVVTDN